MSNEQRAQPLTKAQLKCLIGPRTRDVFETLRKGGELSVAEIQAKLGFASKSVYYQVKKLMAADLVVESVMSNRRAATYRVAVEGVTEPEDLYTGTFDALAAKSVSAQLRKAGRSYSVAVALSKKAPMLRDQTMCRTHRLEISHSNLALFRQRFQELVAEMQACPCDDDAVVVNLLLLMTPDLTKSKGLSRARKG